MKLSPQSALVCSALLLGSASFAYGQISVDVPGASVKLKNGSAAVSVGPGSTASSSAGTIDSDVQMDGVAVINGDVFVDGEKIPHGKTKYTSKKTGKSYRIQWGKDGNVSVEQN